jgi:hypothetical protein
LNLAASNRADSHHVVSFWGGIRMKAFISDAQRLKGVLSMKTTIPNAKGWVWQYCSNA